MSKRIEFHDSHLQRASVREHGAVLLLEAYVHHWEQKGREWMGTGWYQPIRLSIGAPASGPETETEADLYDGRLTVEAMVYRNVLPLPFSAKGQVALWLGLCDGRTIDVTGREVSIEAIGEARFVENLADDMAPDAG
jgi:hypothetical protein